jgi:nicotinamidase-related amidase
MSTFKNREATALLVIDMQNGVVAEAFERDKVARNIEHLVASARSAGTPVVWVQHADAELEQGSTDWEIIAELDPLDTEALVAKHYGDAFEATELEQVLSTHGVGHLVVAGAESDACIRSTIHGAFTRGYDVTLVGDAHTAGDRSAWGAPAPEAVIAHTNLYWQFQSAPNRTAEVKQTSEVVFDKP